jgi:hypothetical protein
VLGWLLHRARAGNNRPVPAMSIEEAHKAASALRFLLSIRRRGQALDCRQIWQFLPAALGLLRELEAARSARVASQLCHSGPVDEVKWRRALAALDRHGSEPVARTDRLIELAECIAPVSQATRQIIWQEVWCGGMAAFAASRDEAVRRVSAFCVANDLPLPQGILNAVGSAHILPHDARHLPSVLLLTAGRLAWRSSLLVYRPERVTGFGGRAVGPNALPAFESLIQPARDALRAEGSAGGAYTGHKARAVVRALLRAVFAPVFTRQADTLLVQLRSRLALLWRQEPDLPQLRVELLHAMARFLGDLIWGEYVPRSYVDRFGFAQCLSCALFRQSDPRAVLRAWLGGGRGCVENLAPLLLAEAAAILAAAARSGPHLPANPPSA